MQLNIEKKFTMLSTKEWMQYLQHKLPNDREKELLDRAQYDEFLRESLDAINSMEGRHLAYQSLNYIHQQIENATGVSESRISNTNVNQYETPVDTKKYVMIGLGALAIALIVFGVFYFVYNNMSNNEEEEDNTMNELVEDTSPVANSVDSSTLPMEQITPDANTAASVPATTATPTLASPNKPTSKSTPNAGQSTNNTNSQNSGENKDRKLFEEAQNLYKSGKIEESKVILDKLKSYDNPYKGQSEDILKNLNR
jgi:hypothetical protein